MNKRFQLLRGLDASTDAEVKEEFKSPILHKVSGRGRPIVDGPWLLHLWIRKRPQPLKG